MFIYIYEFSGISAVFLFRNSKGFFVYLALLILAVKCKRKHGLNIGQGCEGAMRTLRQKAIPLFQEVSVGGYKRRGGYGDYIKDMTEIYKCFIDIDEYLDGNKNKHDINGLEKYLDNLYKKDHRCQLDVLYI